MKLQLLAAWCETRDDFRVFRVDRMSQFESLDEGFVDEPGRTAEDFLKQDTKRS
ncbi:WYL domain-containing protein [Rhizobium leguminosarum]|uniref:WYL domain-containing protein n=1 Tax=Rhizobium leguminosarum TaxID=384 RepID=UPI00197F8A9A|nr:WYL domain-containing protein [Rhizobium leguminosarum]